MNEVAQQIREQVSCLEAAEMVGLTLEANDKTYCFLHEEDTPSLHVYEDHWFCFGCSEKGDVIDLVQKYAGCSFGKACQFLMGVVDDMATEPRVHAGPRRETVDLTERFLAEPAGNEKAQRNAADLVSERWPTLTLEDLEGWGVKVCQHALWIPHHDDQGRITGIKTRSLYTGDKQAVKGSTYPQMYTYRGLDALTTPTAVLCEGESDTWTMHRAVSPEFTVFGLPSGAKTWRPAYGEQLARHRRIFLALDSDTTGQQAADMIERRLRDDHEYRGLIVRPFVPAGDVAEAIAGGWDPRPALGG